MILTSRERIKCLLAFEEPDRIGMADSFWEDTITRWHAEGLPQEANTTEYFGFDFDWLFMDASLRLPEKLVEESGLALYDIEHRFYHFVRYVV